MVNKVTLIGRLGKDPETRKLDNDRTVTKFSLATSEVYKKNGQKVEQTEWHNIEIWDRLAEIAGQYLKKGSLIYLEGRIKTDQYDKNGETRYSTKIVARTMNMMDSKKDDGGDLPF